jgi:dTDP-glucose pyrophosphorylase
MDLFQLTVAPHESVKRAIELIDGNSLGVVIAVNEARCVLGTITDGDIRRAVLRGLDLQSPIRDILNSRAPKTAPIVALTTATGAERFALMHDKGVRQLPIVDSAGVLQEICLMQDFAVPPPTACDTLIMAGGEGQRLRPLTAAVPKPMLPVNNRPVLEWIIERLSQSGIQSINVSVNYHRDVIKQHFGNGETFGVKLEYLDESEPLGTAGAIRLMSDQDKPLLVINGDVLADLEPAKLLAFHTDHHADATVAVREFSIDVPYGVIEASDGRVHAIREKPQLKFFVNAGIYVLSAEARRMIPSKGSYDMNQLVNKLTAAGRTVMAFPLWEYWIDIGGKEEYNRVQTEWPGGASREVLRRSSR